MAAELYFYILLHFYELYVLSVSFKNYEKYALISGQSNGSYFQELMISTSYRRVQSAIWQMFFTSFSYFATYFMSLQTSEITSP